MNPQRTLISYYPGGVSINRMRFNRKILKEYCISNDIMLEMIRRLRNMDSYVTEVYSTNIEDRTRKVEVYYGHDHWSALVDAYVYSIYLATKISASSMTDEEAREFIINANDWGSTELYDFARGVLQLTGWLRIADSVKLIRISKLVINNLLE